MKRWAIALVLVALAVVLAYVAFPQSLSGKRVLFIVAPQGFKEEELFVPRAYLESHGAKVYVTCDANVCVGTRGTEIVPDIPITDVNVSAFDAVVFVGGPGAAVYYNDPRVLGIARAAVEENKVIGAICLAPGILARAGVLSGRRATVWWSKEYNVGLQALMDGNATYVDDPVVVDGRIVTANGPRAANEFAEALERLLSG